MSESSPAACRFAIRDRTAFCFLLTGLLNIDSALTLMSFAGRNDADDFFFAIFILRAIYVNNQEHRPLYGSNGVPLLFASYDAILAEDYARIIENECLTLESDSTVLLLVDPVLFTVPFKSHRYTKCITLTVGSQRCHLLKVPSFSAGSVSPGYFCRGSCTQTVSTGGSGSGASERLR